MPHDVDDDFAIDELTDPSDGHVIAVVTLSMVSAFIEERRARADRYEREGALDAASWERGCADDEEAALQEGDIAYLRTWLIDEGDLQPKSVDPNFKGEFVNRRRVAPDSLVVRTRPPRCTFVRRSVARRTRPRVRRSRTSRSRSPGRQPDGDEPHPHDLARALP